MTDYLIPLAINSIVALAAFRLGWLARSRRCSRALSAMGALHTRNVSEAHQRGVREGICSQMRVETQNARQ